MKSCERELKQTERGKYAVFRLTPKLSYISKGHSQFDHILKVPRLVLPPQRLRMMTTWRSVGCVILCLGGLGRAKDMALESLAYLYFIRKDIALLSSIAYY